jgi:hypothetical protein
LFVSKKVTPKNTKKNYEPHFLWGLKSDFQKAKCAKISKACHDFDHFVRLESSSKTLFFWCQQHFDEKSLESSKEYPKSPYKQGHN